MPAQEAAWPAGIAFAMACLTRYEAWPITAAAVFFVGVELLRRGVPFVRVLRRLGALIAHPAVAIAAFLILSYLTVGSWLVTGGFYAVEPAYYRRPLADVGAILYGLASLNGYVTLAFGALALAVVLKASMQGRASALLVPLALAASRLCRPTHSGVVTRSGSATWYADHGARRRHRAWCRPAAAKEVGSRARGCRRHGRGKHLSCRSPMVLEAQWDRPRVLARQQVTRCLKQHYDGMPSLVGMTSLAHYTQETAAAGFALKQYIHEGVGDMWTDSLRDPGRHAGWVPIAEGSTVRDQLARRQQSFPGFPDGFRRFCEGGGVTLYRRNGSAWP